MFCSFAADNERAAFLGKCFLLYRRRIVSLFNQGEERQSRCSTFDLLLLLCIQMKHFPFATARLLWLIAVFLHRTDLAFISCKYSTATSRCNIFQKRVLIHSRAINPTGISVLTQVCLILGRRRVFYFLPLTD